MALPHQQRTTKAGRLVKQDLCSGSDISRRSCGVDSAGWHRALRALCLSSTRPPLHNTPFDRCAAGDDFLAGSSECCGSAAGPRLLACACFGSLYFVRLDAFCCDRRHQSSGSFSFYFELSLQKALSQTRCKLPKHTKAEGRGPAAVPQSANCRRRTCRWRRWQRNGYLQGRTTASARGHVEQVPHGSWFEHELRPQRVHARKQIPLTDASPCEHVAVSVPWATLFTAAWPVRRSRGGMRSPSWRA